MELLDCLFIFALICLNINTLYSLDCYSCQNIDDPHACNSTISCQTSQVCFLDVKGGIYTMGCADNQYCGGTAGVGIVGRDVIQRQTSNCLECCSTDGCNSDMCKHSKPTVCIDDETVDCARMNTIFHVCQDIQQAKLVCPKFCDLCTLVDGQWSQWSSWSNCDVTCNKGIQTRSRTCTNPAPANGGLDCIGNGSETKHCTQNPCPVHGGWSDWSPWGACSTSCDVGMQRRDRACSNPYPSLNGDHCFGESRDDRICMTGACADGGWSNWGSWSTCSESCDGGVRSKLRTCSHPKPSLLGRYCDGSPEQTVPCNKHPCADGGWSDWGSWGSCSESCGGGIKTRLRSCSNPRPSLLGRGCDGSSDQVVLCNKSPCSNIKVAFTAYGTGTGSSLTAIKFPKTYINSGGAYSTSTGTFTCKIPGIYYFAVTLTKKREDIDVIIAFVRINGIARLVLQSDPYNDSDGHFDYGSYSLSATGTFHLNVYDNVYVQGVPSNFYNDHSSFFTGFLVIPDTL